MNSFFETSQKAREKRQFGPFVRGLRALFNVALVAGVLAVVSVFGLYLVVIDRYEEGLSRSHPRLVQDSYVYDRDGNRIGSFPAGESRETGGFEGMGQHLPNAVVAVEDRRFHDHLGVDGPAFVGGPGGRVDHQRSAHEEPVCSARRAARRLLLAALRPVLTRLLLRAAEHETGDQRRRPLRVVYRTEYDPRDPSFLRGEP